jgi:hypothetical protein
MQVRIIGSTLFAAGVRGGGHRIHAEDCIDELTLYSPQGPFTQGTQKRYGDAVDQGNGNHDRIRTQSHLRDSSCSN